MEGVIGYTTLFAGNFAPRSWAFCAGQIMSISQNTALFSILGVTYGGNGQTTFALPDLRGRTVVGAGQGPGLSFYSLGQPGGVESHTLSTAEMAAHSHTVTGTATPGAASSASTESPAGAVYANAGEVFYNPDPSTSMAPFPVTVTSGVAGSGLPFSTLQPFLSLNYLICLEGVFPARN